MQTHTLEFIKIFRENKKKAFQGNKEIADLLGFSSVSSITEILNHRANISPDKFKVFKQFNAGKKHNQTFQISYEIKVYKSDLIRDYFKKLKPYRMKKMKFFQMN